MHRRSAWIAAMVGGMMGGCAVHYHDPKTGADHLWGVGHLVMRVERAEGGARVIVRGVETIGVAIGAGQDQAYLAAGWHRLERIDIPPDGAAVRIDRPRADFLTARVFHESVPATRHSFHSEPSP